MSDRPLLVERRSVREVTHPTTHPKHKAPMLMITRFLLKTVYGLIGPAGRRPIRNRAQPGSARVGDAFSARNNLVALTTQTSPYQRLLGRHRASFVMHRSVSMRWTGRRQRRHCVLPSSPDASGGGNPGSPSKEAVGYLDPQTARRDNLSKFLGEAGAADVIHFAGHGVDDASIPKHGTWLPCMPSRRA